MTPLVSIIIPVYNAEKFLAATLRSAIGQTWPNKEIIVVDDGSADNSLSIAKEFEGDCLKVYTQQNKGASSARNNGLQKAKGRYIQFLDADDLLSPDKIAAQMEVLEGKEDYICVCSTIHFKDIAELENKPYGGEWFENGSDDPVDFLLKLYSGGEVIPDYGGMIQPNAWLTPRKLIDKAGPWNEFKCPDDDGEFFCRVILAGKGVKVSKKGLNFYRKHDARNSLSGQRNKEATENILLSIDLKYGYLKENTKSDLLNRVFARLYWELGVSAYPQFKTISDQAIKTAKQLGYAGPKYKSGNAATFLSKIFGWQVLRRLSYMKHGY